MRKEIPILYSTAMAQAKLAWRKSQTRRIIKPQPKVTEGGYLTITNFDGMINPEFLSVFLKCPYGQPGDLLWGRESFQEYGGANFYKADGDEINDGPLGCANKWKPSIHMPKEAARIWDEVTGLRPERVADISEEDAIAEGIEIGYHTFSDKSKHIAYRDYSKPDNKHEDYFSMPRNSFRSLWQLINGKPKPIQSKKGGKLITTGYEVYPFDEQAAAEFQGLTTWKGKPLTVITNPWVWVIESKQLSVTGKPAVPAAGKE